MTENTETWVRVGWVGIDSGRLMLADPSYPELMPPEFLAGENDEDYDDDGMARWAPHGDCIAVIMLTPGGDGMFPVSVMYDEDGTPAAVRVDFDFTLPPEVVGKLNGEVNR